MVNSQRIFQLSSYDKFLKIEPEADFHFGSAEIKARFARGSIITRVLELALCRRLLDLADDPHSARNFKFDADLEYRGNGTNVVRF